MCYLLSPSFHGSNAGVFYQDGSSLVAYDSSSAPPRRSFSGSRRTDRLWQEYFADPSLCWDNRQTRSNPAAPDFKHKITKQSLWIDNWNNPGWVKDMLQKEVTGRIESDVRSYPTDPALVAEQCVKWQTNKPGLRSEELMDESNVQQLPGNIVWETLNVEEALALLERMDELPTVENVICILQKCRKRKTLAYAKLAHKHICDNGMEAHRTVGNYLVPMFVECGSMSDAQQVFDRLVFRNEYSWTSLIQGYIECGEPLNAVSLFQKMQEDCVHPSSHTFVALLKACARLRDGERGREVHIDIAKEGLESHYFIGNTLVDMYVKCSSLAEAFEVFDKLPGRDVVSWTALISGYAENGLDEEAATCFQQMQLEGLSPDVVLWNVVILCYADQGESGKAFELYAQMQEQGISPNRVTFLNILKACGNTAALDSGKKIHSQIHRLNGHQSEIMLSNTLIDMYGKCGSMVDARQVFDAMSTRNLVTWTALLSGYTHQGDSEAVFHMFESMSREGIQPTGITFLSVLNACSQVGLVDKGREYFRTMRKEYGITPTIEHCNAMVDLLSRAGHLSEAVELLGNMPFQPDLVMWMTVLGGCHKWGDIELGRQAFECSLQLDDKHAAAYILMSNIYADGHMWEDMRKIEALRVNVEQNSGIEIVGDVHTFMVGGIRER